MTAIITFHPTFAFFHQPYEAGTFAVDVGRLARAVRGELAAKPCIKNNATVMDLHRLANMGKPVAVDIETGPAHGDDSWSGKDPTRCRLRTIGFGTSDFAVSYTWKEIRQQPALLDKVKRILASRDIIKVFHNGPWFDLRVLRRYGFTIKRWVDTRDFRRALSNTSRLSLRYLASIATDVHNWKDEEKKEAKDGKGVIFTDDYAKLKTYNAWDCALTARVYDLCVRDLAEADRDGYGDTVRSLYRVHRGLSVAASEMHTRGLYVHQEWRRFMLHCLEQEIQEKEAKFLSLVGIDGMRCNHNDMRALIYKRHANERVHRFNLPDPLDAKMFTTDEQTTIKVDVDSLLMLLVSGEAPPELVPIIDAFWDVEELKKRRSTLASALLDKAIGPDGRLRPGWNSCGTDTMRFSCSEPNVMNIEQVLRHIIAPTPGWCLVHADKSQLELRVMEAVADDPFLYKAILTGDVYSYFACEWFGLDPAKFDKNNKKDAEARKSAKIIYLGRQYRAGLKAVYGQALRQDRSFTMSRTRLLVSTFDRTLTGIVAYWHSEMERVQRLGYSEGRILHGRHYYPAMPDPSEVANKPIQRTAAEMMNLELLELRQKLRKYVPSARIVIQLHDAVDVECRESDEPVVSRIIMDVMNREWEVDGRKRAFPIEMKTARSSLGETWADV